MNWKGACELYCRKLGKIGRRAIRNLMLWDETLTQKENGEKLGIKTPPEVFRFKEKYGLPCKRALTGRKLPPALQRKRLNVMVAMRKCGYTIKEIAHNYKVSEARVSQILSEAGKIKKGE